MVSRGITLLELLVVLVLIGIVAALALPGYRQQMIRVHRTEAMIACSNCRTPRRNTSCGTTSTPATSRRAPPTGLGLATASSSNKYFLSIAVASDGQSFIATATPTPEGGQAADRECLAFSIDARGRRAVSGTRDTRHCWK